MGATGKDLHIDVPLTNVAIQYRPHGMIADEIAPIVPVGKQSNSYNIWLIADAYRIHDDKRAPGTEAQKIYRDVSSDTYYAENRALKTPLTLEDRENMDAGFIQEMREGRVMWLKDQLALPWEQRVANKCTSGSNVYSYSACGSAWDDYDNSDPQVDVETKMDMIEDVTGYRPNSVLMGGTAWRHFRRNNNVKNELFGSAGSGAKNRSVSRDAAKDLFEVERFLVGGAYYNSAAMGQTAALDRLWGDHVLVYYAPMKPSIEFPSFMYTFRWRKPAIPNGEAVERHPFDPKIKAEEIELGMYQDEKITASNLGALFTNVTSST